MISNEAPFFQLRSRARIASQLKEGSVATKRNQAALMYAIVQHSAFGYKQDDRFKSGLELRGVTEQQARPILRVGGVVFSSYKEANEYIMAEQYPATVAGMIPKAPGRFHQHIKLDDLAVYIPKQRAGINL
jgi:hypothetical protein